jgi:hypothetical protein
VLALVAGAASGVEAVALASAITATPEPEAVGAGRSCSRLPPRCCWRLGAVGALVERPLVSEVLAPMVVVGTLMVAPARRGRRTRRRAEGRAPAEEPADSWKTEEATAATGADP